MHRTRTTTITRAGAAPSLRRPLLLLGAAWVGLAAVLFVWTGRFSLAAVASACGVDALDVRTAPAVHDVRGFVEVCGAAGMSAYRDLQVTDLLYPAVNAAFLAVVLLLLVRRLPLRLGWVLVLPALAAIGDYAENLAAWVLLGRGLDTTTWAEQLFQLGSALKVSATWSTWVAVLVLLTTVAVRTARARRQPPLAAEPRATVGADEPTLV